LRAAWNGALTDMHGLDRQNPLSDVIRDADENLYEATSQAGWPPSRDSKTAQKRTSA